MSDERAEAADDAAAEEADPAEGDDHVTDDDIAGAEGSDGSDGSEGGDAPGGDEAAPEEADAETVGDDDFVRLAYTIRTVSDGRVVDTTDPEVAEESEIDTDEYEFEPRTIALGAGHVFDAVEDALRGAAAGDTGTVEIPAAGAFGEFDEDQVRTVSAEKIDEDDRYPGARVTIDGEQGVLETIVGGRARVDFNHPLAGEDLEYEYELLEVVTDRVEQARGMLGMYLQQEPEVRIETATEEEEVPVAPDEADDGEAEGDEDEDEDSDGDDDEPEPAFETREVESEVLYIEATPQMTMNQQWMFSKQQIAQQLVTRLGIDRVVIEEVIDPMAGMGGMMGGMDGMGGMGGGEEIEEALDDVDADELVEGLEGDVDVDAE